MDVWGLGIKINVLPQVSKVVECLVGPCYVNLFFCLFSAY